MINNFCKGNTQLGTSMLNYLNSISKRIDTYQYPFEYLNPNKILSVLTSTNCMF